MRDYSTSELLKLNPSKILKNRQDAYRKSYEESWKEAKRVLEPFKDWQET